MRQRRSALWSMEDGAYLEEVSEQEQRLFEINGNTKHHYSDTEAGAAGIE